MKDIILYVGGADVAAIAIVGVVGAVLVLAGNTESDFYWKRIVPACGILVGTSFAAGVAMAITRWLTGT